ncbi:MAG: hypothetical protein JSV44_00535 [Candidatus Zixiibacteriota bacterium]|nr:MAG: hypothetical protein JSV44_00535 [candidate division Zixibacteria bacterium]
MFGITDVSFDFLTGHPFLTALFFILLVLLAVYLYRRTNPPLSRGIRVLLTALRFLAVIALFLALFEPVVSYKREYQRKPRLTLLVDRSRSMEISEEGKTRRERADSLLSSPHFKNFSESVDVTTIYFADGLRESDDADEQHQTALGEALRQQSKRELAEPAEYWLLLSDGISNAGVSPEDVAAKLKTPVHSVGLGLESEQKDVSVSGLDYNQVVFAGKPTEITVHLEWAGMTDETAHVKVASGRKTLQTESLTLSPGRLQEDVRVQFVPERSGQQTFQVTVAELDGEVSTDNNSRSFSVIVLKSKLKVLLVANHLDWEYAFLNRFLSRAENVELTPVVFKKNGGYLMGQFPSRQTELNQYDLLVLYDVEISALSSKADMFASFLADRAGGMFVMLGENYLRAPFERWLDKYLPFVSRSRKADLIYAKFNGLPAENYLFHPAVRVSESRRGIRERWRELPPFESLVPVDSITPHSEILVTADLRRDLRHLPVLGFRHYGAGKVLASAAAPFWPWAFFGYGFGGEPQEYPSFFNGIINWLSLKEDFDPIRIVPDKIVYTRGEQVGFRAFVYDLGFRPIEGATGYVAVVAEGMKDSTIVQWLDQGEGRYRAEFDAVSPGRYTYGGVVEKDGKVLKEATGQIVVEAFYIEDFQRQPDFATLTAVSQLSGGRFCRYNRADSLLVGLNREPIEVSYQKEVVVWNKFWLLAAFIGALGIEWIIRKRYQLI